MTIPKGSSLYSVGSGIYSENIEIPIITKRDPTSYDTRYPQGKRWINQFDNNEWVLTSFSSSNGSLVANWTSLQPDPAEANQITQISPNEGTDPVTPSNGALGLYGDGNILTVGGNQFVHITLQPSITINDITLSGQSGLLTISGKNTVTSSCGYISLLGGTTRVNTSASTVNSLVFITPMSFSGTVGYVKAVPSNGYITLTSTSSSDTSTYYYLIIG